MRYVGIEFIFLYVVIDVIDLYLIEILQSFFIILVWIRFVVGFRINLVVFLVIRFVFRQIYDVHCFVIFVFVVSMINGLFKVFFHDFLASKKLFDPLTILFVSCVFLTLLSIDPSPSPTLESSCYPLNVHINPVDIWDLLCQFQSLLLITSPLIQIYSWFVVFYFLTHIIFHNFWCISIVISLILMLNRLLFDLILIFLMVNYIRMRKN